MGRRTENRVTRRQAIVDNARQLFLSNGYARTTMSQVSELVGGSKGTLWSYFASKEALFSAVIEHAAVDFHAEMGAILRTQEPISNSLHAFAKRFVTKVTSDDSVQLQRIIIGETARFPEIGTIFHERALRPFHEQLVDFFLREMRSGTMKSGDPVQAAHEFVALVQRPQMLLLWRIGLEETGGVENYVQHAVEVFISNYVMKISDTSIS